MGKLTRIAFLLAFAVLAAPALLCVCALVLIIPFCLGVPLHAPVYVGIARRPELLDRDPGIAPSIAPEEPESKWYEAAQYQPAVGEA